MTVTLATHHLGAEGHSLDGEPKSTLLEWAERWNADFLFIGASGLHHPGTETLGTVASALGRARPLLGGNRAPMTFPETPKN